MAAGELIGCFGLTEPDHGSDPAIMATRARRDGDDWVLDGAKMWITNAPVADVGGDLGPHRGGRARLRGADGHPRRDGPGDPAQAVAAGLRHRRDRARRGAAAGDAALPEARGLKAPLSCLTEARYGIVWGALGAARDCLETALDYAGTREQFGRPIAGFQLTQAKLADMAVELQKGYPARAAPGPAGRRRARCGPSRSAWAS